MDTTDRQRMRAVKQAWERPDAFATALVILLIDHYGTEALDWAPETIQLELQDDYQVILSRANRDRLMAGITVLTTDLFYRSLPDFVALCNVLSGDVLDDEFDPATASEISWGVTEATLLSPPEDDDPFDAEILGYIGAVLDDEGILRAPDVLRLGDLLGRTLSASVAEQFSDDPEMYSAIWKVDKERTDELTVLVRQRVLSLFDQLESLPLESGNATGLRNKLHELVA